MLGSQVAAGGSPPTPDAPPSPEVPPPEPPPLPDEPAPESPPSPDAPLPDRPPLPAPLDPDPPLPERAPLPPLFSPEAPPPSGLIIPSPDASPVHALSSNESSATARAIEVELAGLICMAARIRSARTGRQMGGIHTRLDTHNARAHWQTVRRAYGSRMTPNASKSIEDALNRSCRCVTMDDSLLSAALASEGASFGAEELVASHPNLFSRVAVFVSDSTREAMAGVVSAVERVVALPAYRELAFAGAHPHARIASRARGAFLGYDFHLAEGAPQLIEINTNPGGGLLNALLRGAQRACCEPVADALGLGNDDVAARFLSMFRAEFARVRPDALLQRVAIVDDDPKAQYLYPEFVLFQRMFEAAGLHAVVCDARELEVSDGALRWQGQPIDLVYNRVTDFELSQLEHAVLARAYVEDLAVVTPHPQAYALYADKRRLITLSDATALRELGASSEDAELLARHVPRTVQVDKEQRERFWAERKQWFFKPEQGYGGKAAYRGDKLTKGTFERLLTERYVAQRVVPPSARVLEVDGHERALKLDVRNFAYEGSVQLVCARLYEGQTTNFRTAGGGFAPVYAV